MNKGLLKIVNHYGIHNQLKKFNEESYELEESIFEYEYSDDIEDIIREDMFTNMVGELADCLVLLKQIQLYYGIHDNQLAFVMNYKINRTLDEIEHPEKRIARKGE